MKFTRALLWGSFLSTAALGLAEPPTPPKSAPKSAVTQPAVRQSAVTQSAARKKTRAKKPVSAAAASTRVEAQQGVEQKITRGANIPLENSSALVPFFEQLYRHQRGEVAGPLRVLHYGDSHVAADEWTEDVRVHFQTAFGDGGSGYSFPGRPWSSYRRTDVKSGSTSGWHSDGLVGRSGDGVYGLGGISMSAKEAHESVYLIAAAQRFELFFLRQPGGGAVQISDNGVPVERLSTDGVMGPSYYHYDTDAGTHRLEAETLDHAPVRLFGWVAEKADGVTYEPLGINGAQASTLLNWNAAVLRSNLERRNPALIVLSYGTNEAGFNGWTVDKYRDLFVRLIQRFREAAPTATILVVGPPDRAIRARNKTWVAMDTMDIIVEAQRQAAAIEGCAFWDAQAKMGGKGSIREWVLAGMAQTDHVHFTAGGYRTIGDAMFRDLMSQYGRFVKAREALALAGDFSHRGF